MKSKLAVQALNLGQKSINIYQKRYETYADVSFYRGVVIMWSDFALLRGLLGGHFVA